MNKSVTEREWRTHMWYMHTYTARPNTRSLLKSSLNAITEWSAVPVQRFPFIDLPFYNRLIQASVLLITFFNLLKSFPLAISTADGLPTGLSCTICCIMLRYAMQWSIMRTSQHGTALTSLGCSFSPKDAGNIVRSFKAEKIWTKKIFFFKRKGILLLQFLGIIC